MAVLELVTSRPDWMGALTVALTRPQGVPERRAGDNPWEPGAALGRPEEAAPRPADDWRCCQMCSASLRDQAARWYWRASSRLEASPQG